MKKISDIPADVKTNALFSGGMTLAVILPLALKFDFYYDLNDDVLIKDILSGVYSGTPESYTMQILYPLSWLLSMLYRLLDVPVFGGFLLLCQFGSIYLIGYRSCQLIGFRSDQRSAWPAKLLAMGVQSLFWLAVFGKHLVFVQYTVAAGKMACAAIFWLITSGCVRTKKSFLRENVPALVLYWTAFCLRSEMALLLLPLAGVAGLCKWGQEKQIFTKENFIKYLSTFGALMLGIGLCQGIDTAAYSVDGWSQFRQYFNSRTELYDYQMDFIRNYEENAQYYEAAGVSRQQHALLNNYNFGADDSIDEVLLAKLEEEALKRPEAGGFLRKSFGDAFWDLRSGHWLGRADMPYNLVFLACAAFAFLAGLKKGRRYLLWQVPLCVLTAAALWMYPLLRDRPADRVFHPLYLGQIAVFAGMLFAENTKEEQKDRQGRRCAGEARGISRIAAASVQLLCSAAAVCVLCISALFLLPAFSDVSSEYANREATNRTNEAVMDYCMSHQNQLFLEDVYSTVYYSEKIGVDRDKPFNYDLLGGWIVKSPLTEKKMAAFGYGTMGEAVRSGKNVSLLCESGSDMSWLEDCFVQMGIDAKVVKTGNITEEVEIYQVISGQTGEVIR